MCYLLQNKINPINEQKKSVEIESSLLAQFLASNPELALDQVSATENIAEGFTPLMTTVTSKFNDADNTTYLDLLLLFKADVEIKNRDGDTALLLAANLGRINIARRLIAAHANINARNYEGLDALRIAIKKNFTETTKVLIESGAQVGNKTFSPENVPIIIASENENPNIVKLLIDAGADVDERNENQDTALKIAVLKNNATITKYLIKAGADVNFKDANAVSLLHLATECGNVEIITALIAKGANLDSKSELNETPLYIALKNSQRDIFKLLLDAGANLNLKYENNRTLLQIVAAGEHWKMKWAWQELLKHNADLNWQDDDGFTALMLSVNHKWHLSDELDLAKALIQKGAEANISSADGENLNSILAKQNIKIDKLYKRSGFFGKFFN